MAPPLDSLSWQQSHHRKCSDVTWGVMIPGRGPSGTAFCSGNDNGVMKMIHRTSHSKLLSCFLTAYLGVFSTKSTGEKQRFHYICVCCSVRVAGQPAVANLSWQVNPYWGSENSCGSSVYRQTKERDESNVSAKQFLWIFHVMVDLCK